MAMCMYSPLYISTSEEEQGPVTESVLSSSSVSSSPSPLCESSEEGLQVAPPAWKKRKRMSKQLSMSETPGDIAWERRRRQILRQERRRSSSSVVHDSDELTDEDLNELKGSIELGFGFNEEDGQTLCNTLPALDLYFAVNRQISPSPMSTPHSHSHSHSHSHGSSLGGRSSSFGSPIITADSDSWKICSPGDDPKHVKTKLRHWAQAVACSVIMQSH